MRTAARTAFFMAVLTLISKLFGFVREMVMANFFGTSYITDAYVMSTAIPNIIFGGIFGAVATAYMPIFSQKSEKEGEASANRFTSEVITILLMVSIISSIVGIIFSDQIVSIFASGFEGETATLTSFFVKITFSYVIFTSISSLLEAFLQYKGTFLPQIVSGYVQNVVVIAVIVISAYFNYYYLVIGWLIGGVVRMVIIGGLAKKKQFHYTPTLKVENAVKSIMVMAIPVFIGYSVNQIGAFVDKTLASGLPEGSVAALNYGNLLVGMITGLTVTILTTMTYPKLAQASALEDTKQFNNILSTGITLTVIIAVPFTLGVAAYSNQVVQIVYERGAFDVAATALTGSAFLCYAVGMTFSAVSTLLIQVFYSNHNTKTPVILGGIAVVIDIILNFVLIGPLGHNGLALSTSIGAIFQVGLLYWGLRRHYPQVRAIESKRKLVYIIIAAIVAVGASLVVYWTMEGAIWMPRMVLFGAAVVAGGALYLGLLKMFRIEEIKLIRQILIKNDFL